MIDKENTSEQTEENVSSVPISEIKVAETSETKTLSSYDIFEKCIARAENLISFHTATESVEEISEQHYCDCYRSAVVLSISALDAFIRKTVISEIVNTISSKNSLNPKLNEYLKGLLNQDKLLDAARQYNLLEKVEEAIKSDFETKSFQGEWKITSYMEMVGYKDIFSEVSIAADINEKNLKRKLNVFTNRRHIIAHSGDYDLNQSPHKENDITKEYANQCIETVILFAKTINDLITKKK